MRFGIKAKLRLAFTALVLLPAIGSQLVTIYVVADRLGREFEARLDTTVNQVQTAYNLAGQELTRRVTFLFEVPAGPSGDRRTPLDPYLAERRQGDLSDTSRRALIAQLPSIAASSGLDVLKILDDEGRVIAQTPLSGREGHRDPAATTLAAEAAGRPLLVFERVPDGSGGAAPRLALEVAVEITRYGDPIFAVGGRLLDEGALSAFVGQPAQGASTSAQAIPAIALFNKAGKPVLGDAEALADLPRQELPADGLVEVKTKDGPGAKIVPGLYSLVVGVSDQNIREGINELLLGSFAVVAGGVVLAWLLGFVIARRLTRPIDDLVRRAGEVARGELQGEIPKARRDEVGELIESFNEMTRRLSESQERLRHAERVAAWQEIARRLAHEIKNPLFPIQMSVETLKKTFGRKNFQEIFEESTTAVLEEVERLKKIVTEFSQFARMPEPKVAAVDLRALLQSALRLCAAANAEANIAVETELADAPPIRGDREQLTQVFLNLLSNAREAMTQGGTIRVSLRREGQEVAAAISDTGPGLSEEARAKLFTPYFTTKEKGTGLGLAIVHRIMLVHGGRIDVDSSAAGTTFTLRFPEGAS